MARKYCFSVLLILLTLPLFSLEIFIEKTEKEKAEWIDEYPINSLQWKPVPPLQRPRFHYQPVVVDAPFHEFRNHENSSIDIVNEKKSAGLWSSGLSYLSQSDGFSLFGSWSSALSPLEIYLALLSEDMNHMGFLLDFSWGNDRGIRMDQNLLFLQHLYWNPSIEILLGKMQIDSTFCYDGSAANSANALLLLRLSGDMNIPLSTSMDLGWALKENSLYTRISASKDLKGVTGQLNGGVWYRESLDFLISAEIKGKSPFFWLVNGGVDSVNHDLYRISGNFINISPYSNALERRLFAGFFLNDQYANFIWETEFRNYLDEPSYWYYRQYILWKREIISYSIDAAFFGNNLNLPRGFRVETLFLMNPSQSGLGLVWDYSLNEYSDAPADDKKHSLEIKGQWYYDENNTIGLTGRWRNTSGITLSVYYQWRNY